MPTVTTESDIDNVFLSRREITCRFSGAGGKLGKLEAAGIISKELGLQDKLVIPVRLKNQVGRTDIIGIFYAYDDEKLAREHVNPGIMGRFDKARKAAAEQA